MFAKPDLRTRQVDARQDVVVLDELILAVHAQGDDHVGREAGVEADLPAQGASGSFVASCNAEGDGEFIIDGQQLVSLILFDPTADLADLLDGFGNDFRLQAAKKPIDLDISKVPIGREADELIGPSEASEAGAVGGARREILGLIDDQARQVSPRLVERLSADQACRLRTCAGTGSE